MAARNRRWCNEAEVKVVLEWRLDIDGDQDIGNEKGKKREDVILLEWINHFKEDVIT